MAIVVHGAGGDLTVSGPVFCGNWFEADVGCVMLGGRGVGVYWEGLWPAGCNDVEYGGDRGAVEGLEYSMKMSFCSRRGGYAGAS